MSTQAVDQYITRYPEEVQQKLKELRKAILEIIPQADEKISYGIPTFSLHDTYVLYIAGYKDHISIHPSTETLEKKLPEVLEFKTGKGTLRFPIDKPLPMTLIKKIINIKVKENVERAQNK